MSTLFAEIDRSTTSTTSSSTNSLEEQRALQLAFELSMLGLSDTLSGCNDVGLVGNNINQQQLGSPNGPLSAFGSLLEDRSKKSQNMTECVPVPSSEHVAEIVGRQGKNFFFWFFILLSGFIFIFNFSLRLKPYRY